jgi:hypothetical protein
MNANIVNILTAGIVQSDGLWVLPHLLAIKNKLVTK